MVRIHAPEPGDLSKPSVAGHKIERVPLVAVDEIAAPLAVMVPEAAPAASTGSIRADMGRALAEGLARALTAGDGKAARIALVALSGLMDDAPEAAPVGAVAMVVDS